MAFGLKRQKNNLYIINAGGLENNHLIDVSISVISKENIITKRIESKKANILNNAWDIKNPKIFNFDKDGNMTIEKFKNMEFISFYNVDKLNSLFKNLDTISFIELLTREKFDNERI